MYVTLNPPVFIKRNAFFLNQYFSDDDYWLFVFGDDETPSVKPLFSRYEEYSIWKGLNRSEIDFLPDDYAGYARVYIRSDLKKTLIKRKYQNFLEFWADATSLLMAIYEVVSFILSYIDYFYSYHSLAQNIFFFKNLENENFFNINKKKNEIQKLILLMNANSTQNFNQEMESLESDVISNNNREIHYSDSVKSCPPKRPEENNDEDNREKKQENNDKEKNYQEKKTKIENNVEITNKDDIMIYKNPSGEKTTKDNSTFKKGRSNQNRGEHNYKYQKHKKYDKYDNFDKYERFYNENKKMKFKKELSGDMSSDFNLNFKRDEQNIYRANKSKKNRRNDDYEEESDSNNYRRRERERERKRKIKVNYSFNIFEIIITQIFKCCMCERMKIKNTAHEKANELIYNKLDVISYVRNMILFDIINQTILDDRHKPIINTLSRPIINVNSKGDYESNSFYNDYRKKNFNQFYDNVSELYNKENKEDREIKLISLTNNYLKSFQ